MGHTSIDRDGAAGGSRRAAGACNKDNAGKEQGPGHRDHAAAADHAAADLAAREAAIQKWVDQLQPSTLSQEQQVAELRWFMEAAKPFAGMEDQGGVRDHRPPTPTNRRCWPRRSAEITGIKVNHDLHPGRRRDPEACRRQMQIWTATSMTCTSTTPI